MMLWQSKWVRQRYSLMKRIFSMYLLLLLLLLLYSLLVTHYSSCQNSAKAVLSFTSGMAHKQAAIAKELQDKMWKELAELRKGKSFIYI
jgi:cell division protein FtsB